MERGWRYLRVSLEQHDTAENEYTYRRAALEKMLEQNRTRALPSWLIAFFSEHQPEYLIRTCLRFDLVNDAIEHTLGLVKKVRVCRVYIARVRFCSHRLRFPQANAPLPRLAPKRAASTWLPYGLVDAVIVAAETHGDLTPDAHNRLGELRSEVAARVRRIQKLGEVK